MIDAEAAGVALLARARALAGQRVDDLVAEVAMPGSHKGSVGQRIERALGLAPRFDDVDDPDSGIEVKTLPIKMVDGAAVVQQVTWVTSATTDRLIDETWATSRVRKKLARVMFVPVIVDDAGVATVGTAFLWVPDAAEEAVLRADWEDLSDLVARGLGFAITSRRGKALHLRPKGRDALHVRKARIVDEAEVVLRPQGFYLRLEFTQELLARHLRW